MSSYVDPIINAAVLSQVDLRRDLPGLMQLDFPERFLPTFLHEGTHHACFMSPLGSTLALLRMRAYRRATYLRTRPLENHWDLLEDVLRQEVTMELLRPLSEGLACFSELDSVPGDSNAMTTPMCSTFFNFGGTDNEYKTKEALRKHGPGLFLFQLLYRARLDPDLSQRRENVLAARFPLKFGGHLAGYMSLKNIWADAKKQSSSVWDAELFSMYLRSYFYDDYGLIAVILNEDLREHDAANAIGAYVHSRLKRLMTLDWEAALKRYEKTFGRTVTSKVTSAEITHRLPDGLENDADLHALGVARLEKLIVELHDVDCVDTVERLLRALDSRRMQKRELLCLGSLEATVEVNGYRRVIAIPHKGGVPDEWPIAAASALDGVSEGKGEGSVEFYLIPADNARAFAIIRGHQVVCANVEGPISESRREQVTSLFGTRSKDLRMIQEQEGNLEFVIAGDAISVVRDQAKVTVPQAIEELYQWLATISVEKDHWRSAIETLSQDGLFGLCGNNGDFIRGLAFLGVASSVCHNKAELVGLAKDRGIDLVDVCQKAKDIEAAIGFKMILEARGQIAVLV